MAKVVTKADESLINNAKNGSTYYLRGAAKYQLKDLPAAVADFNKAANLNSTPPNLYLWRGLALYQQEQYKS